MTRARIRLTTLGALAAAATLAACGGGDDGGGPAVSHAPGSPANPLVAKEQPTGVRVSPDGSVTAQAGGAAKASGAAKSGAKAKGNGQTAVPAGGEGARTAAGSPVGYEKLVDRQSRKPAQRFTPCGLVSRAQASAILGAKVAIPTEAPQGPRCIYRANRSRGFVTVAVLNGTLKQATHGQQRRSAISVAGRTGVCGTLGHTELSIAVSGGRVLSIAAPCGIAKQFAAKAIPQLKD